MARDYYALGGTPAGEPCAQVGKDEYYERMRKETKAYIGQLQRMFPDGPDGAFFKRKTFPHDFGDYHEVCLIFDSDDESHCEYMHKIDTELPEYWDKEAKQELGIID